MAYHLTEIVKSYIVSLLIVSILTMEAIMNTEFHFLFFKTFHAQRNKIRFQMKEDCGLSPGQPKVLRYISKHSDCKLKDIAEECDVEPATVSKILQDLEAIGMLTRQIDQLNKRALKLRITTKGETALTLWKQHCDEVEEKTLNGFSEEDKAQFRLYLSKMYHNLSGKTID